MAREREAGVLGACALAFGLLLAAPAAVHGSLGPQTSQAKKPAPKVGARVARGQLTILGTRRADRITLRLNPRNRSRLQVDTRGNSRPEFTFRTSRFRRIVIRAGRGNDTITLDERSRPFVNSEATTVLGERGRDVLSVLGSNRAERLSLSRAGSQLRFSRGGRPLGARVERIDLRAFGGTDTLTLSSLAGTGLTSARVDGGAGIDQLSVAGSAGNDTIGVAPFTTAAQVSFSAGPRITVAGAEIATLLGAAGNDVLSATGGLGALAVTLDGGPGNDTLAGSDGRDRLLGGDGNDLADGNRGDDGASLGNGQDVFRWDAGDGWDTVDGEADADAVRVVGTAGAEQFGVAPDGSTARISLDTGGGVVSSATEQAGLHPLAGADTAVVNSIVGTALSSIGVDLAGDGAPDSVVVHGTNGNDTVNVAGKPSLVEVTGLSVPVGIGPSEGGDSLVVEGLGGNDTITGGGGLAGLIQLVLNGGTGADTLTGGDSNDRITGGLDVDTQAGGAGDDTFVWSEGDGSETFEGGTGTDTLEYNGTAAGDSYVASAVGSRIRFTQGLTTVVHDLGATERIVTFAGGGADTATVQNLAGTPATELVFALGAGDGSNDSVAVQGTAGNDIVTASSHGGVIAMSGLVPAVRVENVEGGDAATLDLAAGTDQLRLRGSEADDTMPVTVSGTNLVLPGGLVVGGAENLVVESLGGNDQFSTSGNLAALTQLTVDGGAGNDTILAGNGLDIILGGDGNDHIDGQQGNDVAFLGAGDDTFQWDPGDGSDVVEGQAGSDLLLFNGSAASENYDIAPNGGRLRFFRDVAAITLDLDDLERIRANALGGTDTALVHDLAGTDATRVDVNLALTGGGGDGQPDIVTFEGTAGNDVVAASANAGVVQHSGLTAAGGAEAVEVADKVELNLMGGSDQVRLSGTGASDVVTATASGTDVFLTGNLELGTTETLVVELLDGDDQFSATGNLAALIQLTVDGGNGGDLVLGGNGADILLGGNGNDFVDGQQGNDFAFLGAGNDTFQWDPGDGSDVVEGMADTDTLDFNGSAGSEIFTLSPNGNRLLLTRNLGAIVMDIDDTELIRVDMFGGVDSATLNSLAGTDATEATFALGPADLQADLLTVQGTSGGDTVSLASGAGGVQVNGLPAAVKIEQAEAANDRVTVNGLDGNDILNASTLPSSAILLTLNGGANDDTLTGGQGGDILLGEDGNDHLTGGLGADTIDCGPGNDVAVTDGTDTVANCSP